MIMEENKSSTSHLSEKTEENLIYLCSCAVKGKTPDKKRIQKMNLQSLYLFADKHMLTAIVDYALQSAGIQDPAFVQAGAKAVRKMAIMDTEQEKIIDLFEKNCIWYMPLKGALLKDLYPAYGIRQMSDRDILIDSDRADDVRQIMMSLGYRTEKYNEDYHDCYNKDPVSNFEIHRRLMSPMNGKKIYNYYLNSSHLLKKDSDNAFGYHLDNEDFYVFLVTHEYKHYTERGTGLRSLLDIFLYLTTTELNMDYVSTETAKLGIDGFERANRALALHLFNGEELASEEKEMLEYVLSCGTYGLTENRATNQLAAKGKTGYFISRLTLPYARMLEIYPFLKTVPVLYPFCWFHRLIHAFLFKNKTVMYQLRAGLTWKGSK